MTRFERWLPVLFAVLLFIGVGVADRRQNQRLDDLTDTASELLHYALVAEGSLKELEEFRRLHSHAFANLEADTLACRAHVQAVDAREAEHYRRLLSRVE